MRDKTAMSTGLLLPQAPDFRKVRACVNKKPPRRPNLPPGVLELVMERGTFWKPGQTLGVQFLAGSANTRARVLANMKKWEQYANIHFALAEPGLPGTIRVNFTPGAGSYSYIGTGANLIAAGDETMNLGWIDDSTDDAEVQRVVLHETGHALGCEHEQSSPVANIHWNLPATYAYYESSQGWTKEDVDQQVFAKLTESETIHTQFDPFSIMEYPVPAELTTDGVAIGWNMALTTSDEAMIGEIYPFGVKPVTPPLPSPSAPFPLITVGGLAARSAIPSPGQPAKFTLDVATGDLFTLVVIPGQNNPPNREPGVILRNSASQDFKLRTTRDKVQIQANPGRYTLFAWHPLGRSMGEMWARALPGASQVVRVS